MIVHDNDYMRLEWLKMRFWGVIFGQVILAENAIGKWLVVIVFLTFLLR